MDRAGLKVIKANLTQQTKLTEIVERGPELQGISDQDKVLYRRYKASKDVCFHDLPRFFNKENARAQTLGLNLVKLPKTNNEPTYL
jgi:hypothetical protein